MTQPNLIDYLADESPLPPLANPVAHSGDPATSHEAAANVTASGTRQRHARWVLELVAAHPGSTAIELMRAQTETDLDEYQIRRRLTDLKAAGLVEQGEPRTCRIKQTKMVTWYVRGGAPPKPQPAPRPATSVHRCNGHALTVSIYADGRRTFECATMPDLARRFDGVSDASPVLDEFERRAQAG